MFGRDGNGEALLLRSIVAGIVTLIRVVVILQACCSCESE
jgi:hypothetical protein